MLPTTAKRSRATAQKSSATPRSAQKALRPRDIKDLYGIPPGTLHFYCEKLPAEKRLPSLKLPGRCGRKGKRLVFEHELIAWLERYRAHSEAPTS